MFETFVRWLTDLIFSLGYPGITLLMAVESSFFPFPSEVVLPPAGYLAAQGRMNLTLVVGAGLLGSLLGALFNYSVAVFLGRPFLVRFGKYVLVRESHLDRAEKFFADHGEISTFVGRLVPVVRQLISVPAGVARMRMDRFVAYTALGAGIWCVILTAIGWTIGKNAGLVGDFDSLLENPAVHQYSKLAFLILAPILATIVLVYVLRHRKAGRRDHPTPTEG